MESNCVTVRRIIIVVLCCSLTTSGAVVEGHQTFQNGYFHGHFNGIQPTCEPIKIGLCLGVGYNETMMPNMVGHDGQSDADALLQTFTPLIQYGCSSQLKLFLCSAYVPMCTDKVAQPIGPCRDLCQSVRSRCEPVLVEFGFTWPASLDCNLFHPENNHLHMCIPGSPEPSRHHPGQPSSSSSSSSSSGQKLLPSSVDIIPHNSNGYNPTMVPPLHLPPPSVTKIIDGANSQNNDHALLEGYCGRKIYSRQQCWILCGKDNNGASSLFTETEKAFAKRYMFMWTLCSLLGASITVLAATTFARRMSSPAERPIVYMGLSQIFYSVGVMIGITGSGSPCLTDKATGLELLAKGPQVPPLCALVFLLTYFFATASVLWWVMLCLSWLLSVNKSFANSLENREWSLFHLITWGLSSVLTCTVLLNKNVDADELTGLCGVGFQDSDLLLYFHLIPLGSGLGNGLIFLLAGFCLKLRKKGLDYQFVGGRVPTFTNVQQKRLNEKSRATWLRVLIFSLVHLVPVLCQVAAMSYEFNGRPEWEAGLSKPNSRVLLIRHTMGLVLGLSACVWILWIYSWKSWTEKLSALKKRISCKKFLGSGNSSVGNCTGSTNTSFNPSTRSLPAIPEERLPMSAEIRTETWRRGETIV